MYWKSRTVRYCRAMFNFGSVVEVCLSSLWLRDKLNCQGRSSTWPSRKLSNGVCCWSDRCLITKLCCELHVIVILDQYGYSYWMSWKNSLGLKEVDSMNKVSLVWVTSFSNTDWINDLWRTFKENSYQLSSINCCLVSSCYDTRSTEMICMVRHL